jgi:hypothetical protein
MEATHAAHSILAEATAFLASSMMPPPPCIQDPNSIARPLPDGCAAATHHFFDDISYPRHLEKCPTHFWIKVSEILLDVLRHLIRGETFHSEHHTFTPKVKYNPHDLTFVVISQKSTCSTQSLALNSTRHAHHMWHV